MMLAGKTIFITGASRGIGLAIGKRAAADGANVVIAAKTTTPHPKLPGTIYTAAAEVEAAGGKALACEVDIRSEESVQAAVDSAVEKFGAIDVLINCASAISLTPTLETPMKKWDLMSQVNGRGTYLCSRVCLPHLLRSGRTPHILNISPPLNFEPRFWGPHVAYSIQKMSMSLCVLGMAEEFEGQVAVNALWPRTAIATAAVEMLGGQEMMDQSRKPEIMADAAYAILCQNLDFTGRFLLDDEVLRDLEGVTDFESYACVPGAPLMPDLFVEMPPPSLPRGRTRGSPRDAAHSAPPTSDDMTFLNGAFDTLQSRLTPSVCKLANQGVYSLQVGKGDGAVNYFIDAKLGKAGPGVPESEVDITLAFQDAAILKDVIQGKANPALAFMQRKISLKGGDMKFAMSLQALMANSSKL